MPDQKKVRMASVVCVSETDNIATYCETFNLAELKSDEMNTKAMVLGITTRYTPRRIFQVEV